MSTMRRYSSLLVFATLVALAAWVGSRYLPDAWYAALDKPAWNPPNTVFAPVWTVLYALIAIAGWRVWIKREDDMASSTALAMWFGQWIANGLWMGLFFGMHKPVWALVDIVANLMFVLAFMGVSWRWERIAAWLFVPYAAWLAFALSLNAGIVLLNR